MASAKKITASPGIKMLQLPVHGKHIPADFPPKTTNRDLKAQIADVFKKAPTFIGSYLTLSAAKTKVADKGYINAIGCRSIFPDGPNIDFVPADSFGGSLELWLLNVAKGDSFVITFRVVCGHQGMWKISSSETAMIQTAIVPAFQNIDFFIPKVNNDYGMILIRLEPVFSGYGSWVFKDVTVQKVEF